MTSRTLASFVLRLLGSLGFVAGSQLSKAGLLLVSELNLDVLPKLVLVSQVQDVALVKSWPGEGTNELVSQHHTVGAAHK